VTGALHHHFFARIFQVYSCPNSQPLQQPDREGGRVWVPASACHRSSVEGKLAQKPDVLQTSPSLTVGLLQRGCCNRVAATGLLQQPISGRQSSGNETLETAKCGSDRWTLSSDFCGLKPQLRTPRCPSNAKPSYGLGNQSSEGLTIRSSTDRRH